MHQSKRRVGTSQKATEEQEKTARARNGEASRGKNLAAVEWGEKKSDLTKEEEKRKKGEVWQVGRLITLSYLHDGAEYVWVSDKK